MSEQDDKPEEAKLVVDEQKDGSVTVEGIELSAEEQSEAEKTPEKMAEGGPVPEDGGDDQPDDTEAIRAIRRDKRKAKKMFHRQQQQEKDYRLQQLQRQNQDLLTRLQAVEQRTHGSEVARIDKAIEDQQLRIQYAKMKIAEATKEQDGEAVSNSMDMLYEARRTAEQLENLKKQSSAPQAPSPTAPDKTVQRMAASWMERNSWYDPSGEDEDSEIALTIDKRMAREGWDPRSSDYWEELDSRLQKRLPNRYSESAQEEKEPARRPKSVVTSSGRESVSNSNGRGTFTLSPEQVRAMKDAGMWEDPVLRNKMIKRYAVEARNNRSN